MTTRSSSPSSSVRSATPSVPSLMKRQAAVQRVASSSSSSLAATAAAAPSPVKAASTLLSPISPSSSTRSPSSSSRSLLIEAPHRQPHQSVQEDDDDVVDNDDDAQMPGNDSDSDESLDGLIDRVSGLGVIASSTVAAGGGGDARTVLRSHLRKGKRGRLRQGVVTKTTNQSSMPAGERQVTERKYYVLSTAGKLIYTNDEPSLASETGTATDPGALVAFVGVIQAVVSIFLDSGDKLRHIETDSGTKIVFLLRPPLYIVVASNWAEPLQVLRTHLEYLHHLILALVTQTQLNAVFKRRSNYDLRRLLEGTDGIFSSLLNMLSDDLNTSLGTIRIVRCNPAVREAALKALTPKERPKDVLYMLMLAPELVTLIRPRSHSIHPSDLHLLLASIPKSKDADDTSFYPFCLPKFNNQGFLYVYSSWRDDVGVVIVRSEREVENSRMLDQAVRTKLKEKPVKLPPANPTVSVACREFAGELSLPGLRHFVYKHRLVVQSVEADYEGDYGPRPSLAQQQPNDDNDNLSNNDQDDDLKQSNVNRRRLMTLYEDAHEALKTSRMYYVQTDHESIYAWSTSTFELYVTASPLLPKRAIVALAKGVSRWIKEHEKELFLLGAPSF